MEGLVFRDSGGMAILVSFCKCRIGYGRGELECWISVGKKSSQSNGTMTTFHPPEAILTRQQYQS